MKTIIQSIATLCLLIVSVAAFSAEPPSNVRNVQVLPAQPGTLKMLYYNPKSRNVTVRIYNEDGVIFKDKIKIQDNGFVVHYNVSEVYSEEFWIEIADEDTATRFRIQKDNWGNVRAAYWDWPTADSKLMAAN